MTLHWWMHWFWVTAQLAVILASPLPSTTEVPRIQEFSGNSTEISKKMQSTIAPTKPRAPIDGFQSTHIPEHRRNSEITTGSTFRIAKAIGFYDLPSRSNNAASSNVNPPPIVSENSSRVTESSPLVGETSERRFFTTSRPSSRRNWSANVSRARTSSENLTTRIDGTNGTVENLPTSKRDSRITWVLTTERPNVRRRTEEIIAEDIIRNFSDVDENDGKDLTVLPLRLEAARFKLVVNRTRTITANTGDGFSTRTINGSEDIEIDQELAEPRLSATAASILQGGISDSTRLSRARNTFSEFQRDREEDRSSDIDVGDSVVGDVSAEIENSTTSAVDIAAITGSCLATVVLLSTMASLGFVMYRRKYLNPPQTLNSDKCSNPDSSGYIDDSTIRDNSEEMYSLDNDSFLNSLEAMTIQNYWTDSVKHTKL